MANYDNNIVNGPDLLSESQGPMQQNFEATSDFVDVNHIAFNDPDQGKHKWVTFPLVPGITPPTATEITSFSLKSGFTNQAEYVYATTASANILNISARKVPFATTSTWGVIGGQGLVYKTFLINAVNGVYRALFPTGNGIPVFSNILTVQASIQSAPVVGNINGTVAVIAFNNIVVAIRVESNVANNNNPFGVFITAIGSI